MTSLYEALKASKTKRFPDYWTLLWGRKLSAKLIKTLTSVLPLTFNTSETKLREWEIRGNDDVGKNVVNLVGISSKSAGNVTLTPDAVNGTVTVTTSDGQASTAECVISGIYLPANIEGNYYLSGCPEGGDSARTYDIYPWDETAGRRPMQWDGVTQALSSTGNTPVEVQFIAGHRYRIGVRVRSGNDVNGLIFRPMVRPADTTADFEPYQIGVGQHTENGYIIPLSVNGNAVNISIGDSPLTAGESVSQTSTGIGIATAVGANTISTSLFNAPEMTITYKGG